MARTSQRLAKQIITMMKTMKLDSMLKPVKLAEAESSGSEKIITDDDFYSLSA
jgi:hypothetical protein